jgi:hypothetical protein
VNKLKYIPLNKPLHRIGENPAPGERHVIRRNEVNRMNEIEESKICMLCDGPADIETSKGTGGNRFIVYCSGLCPTFEISRRAIKELRNKPNRKSAVIQKIKAFAKENPDDMPLIRMVNGSRGLMVTTRSREIEKA